VFFQTLAFSTVGNSFVRLSFDHIGKIHFGQRGYISVSTNNGATWTTLSGTHYRGSSTSFATLGYVNEVMYANSATSPFWGGATTVGQGIAPTNGWWANEVFDISSIAEQWTFWHRHRIFASFGSICAPVPRSERNGSNGWLVH